MDDEVTNLYMGEMNEEGEMHGKGVLTFGEGYTYKGRWFKDKKHGFGVQHAWGDYYIGDWKDSVQSGYGLYVYQSGNMYEGGWLDGKKDGRGIYKFENGSVYEGGWKANLKDGYGVYRWPGGDYYAGEWVKGNQTGAGEYHWGDDGSHYVGGWLDDKAHGKGVFCSNFHGYRFEGQYEHGLRTEGVIQWPNGDSWVGVFYPDRSSKGTLTKANGEVIVGEWTDYTMKTMKSDNNKG